ncbi:replication initiation protein [Bordetella hinzii]|uniref:replication initiation protein n=1 Tax=Bordetella hinzii TaxID=103855 RepID=UPI00045B107F|nr:replication initiation protein [Bordetella hinzii]KCB47961.1 primase alpha helix C-terminal domain protein [Bordetella hinzii 4161]KXA74440.1 hypothetical protein AXA74_03180 [Bordetella hinzii LMG 13501]QDJ35722.1 hypothetical protein CBR67_03145 [Bordetella hinzii]VEH32034.1 Replicase family [Bordetella hinzii]
MIEELIESLLGKLNSTDNFEDGTKYRRKDKALGYRYIEHNQLYKRYIVLDIDSPSSAFLWEEKNLPAPTIITISPESGRCHYLWELKTPVIYTQAGRRAPQRFYEAVDIALTRAVPGADPAYVGRFTKNPCHPHWKVLQHRVSYEFEDFMEYVDITSQRELQRYQNGLGRNCTLFDNLRFWAYPAVKLYDAYEDFQEDVNTQAFNINAEFAGSPAGTLFYKEVLSTAKSVGTWTWRHRHDKRVNRGVMALPADMLLAEKQRQAAAYTNEAKMNDTQKRIIASVTALKAQGTAITQNSIAVHSGLSLRSVKRNWSQVEYQFSIYKI